MSIFYYSQTNQNINSIMTILYLILDIVNRQNFVEMLETMKYKFKSENDLIVFTYKIFKETGIFDDNYYHIRSRKGYTYDYILNTTNKTIEELFMKL